MKPAELAQHLNFDYYLVSSSREMEVFSPQPAYLEPAVFERMVFSAETLYRLIDRIVKEYLKSPALHPRLCVPDFPCRKQVLGLPFNLIPFFWTRYDAFERAGGGIFFSEFNYDKPCAQREIMVSNEFDPEGNPSRHFADRFRSTLAELWSRYGNGGSLPTVGILVDPSHYEETHLAFLYADLIKPLGYRVQLVGGQNLRVKGDKVTAFGETIDVILRQFPTEFSREVRDYPRILRLLAEGKVLMLNDPRAIVPQAKSLFAYLWELYEQNPGYLSGEEKNAIRETIPYTRMFSPSDLSILLSERGRWVVKAVFGRYSEEVYIGAMMDEEEWRETLEEVSRSGRAHVIQEFVPIKRRITRRFNGVNFEDTAAYGNYGIYFTGGEFAGLCVRWSSDYLTADDTVWFSPVGVKHMERPFILITDAMTVKERRSAWKEVAEEAAFQYGYTNSYTGELESFSLDTVILTRAAYRQIAESTEGLAGVFLKTRELIQDNYELFGKLLGIPGRLADMVAGDRSPWLTWFGRFDWVFDRRGELKLLELNTDTPAGLESIGLNHLISRVNPQGEDPNRGLPSLLAERFNELLTRGSGSQPVRFIGAVTSVSAEEDWFNTTHLIDLFLSLPYQFVLGDVSGLQYKNGDICLYGRPLDALYRFYPLDWLAKEEYYKKILPGLKKVRLINPPSALIPQSKAFLAVVWQLKEQGFYPPAERKLIERRLVPSFLHWPSRPCVIKPYLGREGQGVKFSYRLSRAEISELAGQDLVYQELVEVLPVDLTVRSTYQQRPTAAYPVIGAFIVGNEFGGLYTRLGAKITDRYAVVCPTYIEE